MREVGRAIDFSYEHVRKAVAGEVAFTREFSDALSHELGLDAGEMWATAERQRFEASTQRLAKAGALRSELPRDTRVRELWAEMSPLDREAWIGMGRSILEIAARARRQPVTV
jgi:hypothetical protein